MEENQVNISCDLCGVEFNTGDKILILRITQFRMAIGMYAKDICVACKDKIIAFTDTIKSQNLSPSL